MPADAFATAQELTEFLGHDVPSGRAELLLKLATAAVANAAGVPIFETTETVTIDGNGARSLVLPAYPVTGIDQVKVAGDEVDPAGYSWSRTGELRRSSGVWPASLSAIEVTYTHGYPTGKIPTEIKAVTLHAASRAVVNPARLNSYGDPVAGNAGFGGGGDGAKVIDLFREEANLVRRAIR